MSTRQFLWLAPRITCLPASPPAIAPNAALRHQRRPIHDPPIRPRPAVGQRRWSFHATHDPTTNFLSEPLHSVSEFGFVSRFPDSTLFEDEIGSTQKQTPLERLLRALQYRDVPRIVPLFIEWANALIDEDSDVANAALNELRELPNETFSEILRWIDPVANPANDVVHGLNITVGQTQHIESSNYADSFGVRVQHMAVLKAIDIVTDARRLAEIRMNPLDYQVAIRCAGAASNTVGAVTFWGDMSRDKMYNTRQTGLWTEFTKALFHTEPLYYQFDRARMVILARSMYVNRRQWKHVKREGVYKMERLRLSTNSMLRRPFNRSRTYIERDLRMWMRQKRKARVHWNRAKFGGRLIDEGFLRATMISYSRSSSLNRIKGDMLKRGFYLRWKEEKETGDFSVSRGKEFLPGNPRAPTVRLLDGVVETFGSMTRIRPALHILVYSSHRWGIPIPHRLWSNLLAWTYVAASKTVQRMRRLTGNEAVNVSNSKTVLQIWKIMRAEPFNIQPSFEDYNLYIKALIINRQYRAAIDVIRNEMVPYYRRIEEEHCNVVENDLLQETTELSYQRKQIEARKEYVWYHIASWFTDILKTASKARWQREGNFMKVVIPDLIAEFGEFFPKRVAYKTAQGRVAITRPYTLMHTRFSLEKRVTMPTPWGGMMVTSQQRLGRLPDLDDREFVWPQHRRLNIKQSTGQPRERLRATGVAPYPRDANARQWYKTLVRELCTWYS